MALFLAALVPIVTAAMPATAQSCVQQPEGLVGWWPGDVDASDLVGGNHGVLVGETMLSDAIVGQGFDLGGGDDAVYVSPDPAFDFGAGSFSVHAWVSLAAFNLNGYNVIGGQRVEAREFPGWILLHSHTRWQMQVGDTDGYRDYYDVFSDGPVVQNEFTHLVVVVDRDTNFMTMYVDGQEQSDPGDITGLGSVSNDAALMIGQANELAGFEWVGLIDEFALFNRALTAEEIEELYLTSQGICPDSVETVQIDIRPGSADNPLNPRSRGVLPVAILSSKEFDALEVDPETLELAGAGVAARCRAKKLLATAEDVNGDGWLDLLVKCEVRDIDLSLITDGLAKLTGLTFEGGEIVGADTVRIIDGAKRDKGSKHRRSRKPRTHRR